MTITIAPTQPPIADLARTLVESSNTPILLLNEDAVIVSASRSFAGTFGLDEDAVMNRPVAALGDGEWAFPELDHLLRGVASGVPMVRPREVVLSRTGHPDRQIELVIARLDRIDHGAAQILLTAIDVTEVRQALRDRDRLLREKEVLFQELQHRIANSLQIVASVLMQSARTVLSDETRAHLHGAHHRVMSVAAVQRQLAGSPEGKVALRPYLADLCRSITQSLVRDEARVAIVVDVDASVTDADDSVSLGLIITELVINALKHGFPDQTGGTITVCFVFTGGGWALSVRDDGIGIDPNTPQRPAGLGTSIVDALARKLGACVTSADAGPGRVVGVIRDRSTTQAG